MKNRMYITVGSVHVPAPMENLSVRGHGPKKKDKKVRLNSACPKSTRQSRRRR